MSKLRLFGWRRSTFTRSVLLALKEKGLDFDFISIDPFDKEGLPESYKQMQPFGKVPVLEDGTFQLYETTAILRYLDEAFEGPALQPAGARERARMHQMLSMLNNYGYNALVWDIYVNLREGTGDRASLARGASVGGRLLGALERYRVRPLLCGSEVSLADCHLAPILFYLLSVPAGEGLAKETPGIMKWWKIVLEREGWKEILTAEDSSKTKP